MTECNSAIVDGYKIMAYRKGTIIVVTPEGKRLSCLHLGTHAPLAVLPKHVRKVAEGLANW